MNDALVNISLDTIKCLKTPYHWVDRLEHHRLLRLSERLLKSYYPDILLRDLIGQGLRPNTFSVRADVLPSLLNSFSTKSTNFLIVHDLQLSKLLSQPRIRSPEMNVIPSEDNTWYIVESSLREHDKFQKILFAS